MRSQFDNQLARLDQEMIEMGKLCEESIDLAARALASGDPESARSTPRSTARSARSKPSA